MRGQPFIPFSSVEEGSNFKARGKWWLKTLIAEMKNGKRFNAFPFDPITTIVDITAGSLFDDATLVQLVREELPLQTENVVQLRRVRT